ncbi:MAG: glucosyl transferase [Leptolyngbyaceae cyanobacterium SL_7_1]|nr:glucosyl transferase [Leptolyngbyaceae cyanobacterium SL_7_1]
MILISVGTESRAFDRLMQWVELLLKREFFPKDEEIVVHCGQGTTLPSGVVAYPTLSHEKLRGLLHNARLIITHCGHDITSLLEESSATYILVPRSPELGECEGACQINLAATLAQSGVPVAWSPGDLVRFIASPYRSNVPIQVDRSPASSRT